MIRTFVFQKDGVIHSKVLKITDHPGHVGDVFLNAPEGHSPFEWSKDRPTEPHKWQIDTATGELRERIK
jgi:hypothetical protein